MATTGDFRAKRWQALTLILIRGSDSRAHVELGQREATESASA